MPLPSIWRLKNARKGCDCDDVRLSRPSPGVKLRTMRLLGLTLLFAAPLLMAAAAEPPRHIAPLAPDLARLLEAAIKGGNEADIDTLAKYLRAAAPESADTVAIRIAAWKEQRREATTAQLSHASFFSLIKGQIEFGGMVSTGNTDSIGVHTQIDLTRDGLNWRHKLKMLGEYQESDSVPTREHYLAAFESNYKFDDRFYAYGTTQFESDRFFGYGQRYATSLGLGYSAQKGRLTTLDVELGPAYRLTDFTDGAHERNFAARGSIDFAYQLNRGLTISNNSSAYLQSANSTLASTTALKAKLFGPVSGQFSYSIQYESLPPDGRRNTDTTSRAALVYQF